MATLPGGAAVGAAIAAIFALAFAVTWVDQRNVLRTAHERLESLSRIAVLHVDLIFAGIDLGTRTIDIDPIPQEGDRGRAAIAIHNRLRLIQRTLTPLAGIGFIGADGRLLANAVSATPEPIDFSARNYFQALRTDPSLGLVVAPPVRTIPSLEVAIPVARAAYWPNGRFAGVVAGRLDPDYFGDFFRSLGADTVAITLADGTILSRFPQVDLLAAPKLTFDHAAAGPGVAAQPFELNSPVDGSQKIATLSRVASAPVFVDVAFDKSRVVAGAVQRRNAILTAAVAISGLILALALVSRRRAREHAARAQAQAQASLAAEAREAAVEANRRKSEFLAHMSHEIRTPLNAIIGFSQMISNEMLGPLGQSRYRDYAADILFSAEHLLSVVNNVLDLAKVEAGKWTLETDEVHAADLIESTCRLAAARAAHEAVRVEHGEVPPLKVVGDRRSLVQILLNLTINAIKFAGEDRRVSLDCARTGDGGIEFMVADSGPGMSAEDIERALRPFETASSVQARQRHDTGLGLPLARAFAELHDGTLTLESALGNGTLARLRLPRERVRPAED